MIKNSEIVAPSHKARKVEKNFVGDEVMTDTLPKWLLKNKSRVAKQNLFVKIPMQGVSFASDNAEYIKDYAQSYKPESEVEPVTIRLFTGKASNVPFANGKGFLPLKMLASVSFHKKGMICHSAEETKQAFETEADSGEEVQPMGDDYIYSDWSQIEAELINSGAS